MRRRAEHTILTCVKSPETPAFRVNRLIEEIFEDDLHVRRVLSLANATLGAMRAGVLGVHAIGLGLAAAKQLNPKHTIKQVDRLLSNPGVVPWELFAAWVPFVVGQRTEILVAVDWTDFDADNQATVALHSITSHGRATPLLWKTVEKSELAGWRNEHEDAILQRLRDTLPKSVRVTVLGDRAFGDQKLYAFLKQLGFDYIIRFRECIHVEDEKGGDQRIAADWVPGTGRPKLLRSAKVTSDRYEVPTVVCVKKKGMKDSWCLASSLADASAAVIIALYSRRFTIEENFRDTKDIKFGMGLAATHIGRPDRRDRILLIGALTVALLTILGAAGESVGLDMWLKANTTKRRTHSLFRQGYHYYDLLPGMKPERLEPLVKSFEAMLAEHKLFDEVLGWI